MENEFEYLKKLFALQDPQRGIASVDSQIAPDSEVVTTADEVASEGDELTGLAAPSFMASPVTVPGQQVQKAYLDMADVYGKKRASASETYERLLSERENMESPQINQWDQILGAMAPLAVAALGGEAGALSQPSAFTSYQGYLEKDRTRKKEIFDEQRKQNELRLLQAEKKRSGFETAENKARQSANVDAVKLDAAERRAQIAAARPSQGELDAATVAADVQVATDALEATRDKDGKYPSEKTEIFPLLEMTFRSNLAPVQAMQMFIKDPNIRQQISAEYQWLNTVLREKTGAAIANGEYPSFAAANFPRRGDNEATKAAKKRLRDQALSNYKFKAQRAGSAPLVGQEPPPPPKKQLSVQEMREALKKQQKGNQ